MTEERFNRIEADMAQLALAAAVDPYLADLLELAERGVSTPVGLFANGMVFVGSIASREKIAAEVDQHRHRWADAARKDPPEVADSEAFEQVLQEFETAWATRLEQVRAAKAAAEEEVDDYLTDDGFDFEKAPPALTRRILRYSNYRFITLENVQVVAPGQPGTTRLPVVRLPVEHVVAWWLIRVDTSGNASFQLWTVDQA